MTVSSFGPPLVMATPTSPPGHPSPLMTPLSPLSSQARNQTSSMKVTQFRSLRVYFLMIHTHFSPNISPSAMPLSLSIHSSGSMLMAQSLLVPGSLHNFTPFSLTPLLVATLYVLAVRPLWPLLVFPPPKSRLLVAGHPLCGSAMFVSTLSCYKLFFSTVAPSMTLLLLLFNPFPFFFTSFLYPFLSLIAQ